jgi:hypothetical protein
MSWLRDPICPNCEAAVPLQELWRAAPRTSRGIAIRGVVGISCPHCAVRLRVQQHRLIGASVVVYVAMIVAVWTARSWLPVGPDGIPLAAVVSILAAFVLLLSVVSACAPRLLTLRRLYDGESVVYPLELPPDEGPEPTQEDDDRAALAEVMSAPDQASEPGRAWRCPKCGEENPGNFDACWKCETDRPGAATRGPEQT